MHTHPTIAVQLPDRFEGAGIMVAAINETFSLRETIEGLERACAPEDIAEILILLHPEKTTPDCRATAEALVAESAGRTPVRIVLQTIPFAGGAYRSAIPVVKGSHCVMMSADLETPPEAVGRMIIESKKNPRAIVTASRWMKGGGFSGYSPVKRICNAVFQKTFSILFLTRLSDLTYAFRLFPVKMMRALDWKETRHPFFLETSLVPLRLGVPFVEIPAHWSPRPEGASQNSFLANFRYFKTAFRVRFAPRKRLVKQDFKAE